LAVAQQFGREDMAKLLKEAAHLNHLNEERMMRDAAASKL
jgi:hypothetical protein